MAKPLYKTKTFWAGLAGVLTGIGLIVSGETSEGIVAILSGVSAIFLRDGIRTGGK